MDESNPPAGPFPTTQWSLIVRVKSADHGERMSALSEICERYWPAVYAYFRSCVKSPHDAEDHTQSLFAALIERDDFAKADSSRGRLRSYLLVAAKNHLRDAHRHEARRKRGGEVEILSLDFSDAEARCLPYDEAGRDSPERVFERQWATSMMESVVAGLEASYREREQEPLFRALLPFIVATAAQPQQAELAKGLGMTHMAVRVAIHRLRQRYAEAFRHSVHTTLGPEESVDEEISRLMAAFGN